jgi:hydrogenase nickel incorporation protein HypA/HybF
MHEMGIANSVLDAVHKELRFYPGKRATKVGLRIGEFAGVEAESLRFCFGVLVRDSALEPLALDIEISRVEKGARGDELDLAYLELESENVQEVAV